MGYPVCPNRIHSSGINGPRKSLFEITKSFLGDGHRLKLFLGVWESGALRNYHVAETRVHHVFRDLLGFAKSIHLLTLTHRGKYFNI